MALRINLEVEVAKLARVGRAWRGSSRVRLLAPEQGRAEILPWMAKCLVGPRCSQFDEVLEVPEIRVS